jgi:hypothetical protein
MSEQVPVARLLNFLGMIKINTPINKQPQDDDKKTGKVWSFIKSSTYENINLYKKQASIEK